VIWIRACYTAGALFMLRSGALAMQPTRFVAGLIGTAAGLLSVGPNFGCWSSNHNNFWLAVWRSRAT